MGAKKPADYDALDRMRHSAAHLLAAAVMKMFPDAKLGVGDTGGDQLLGHLKEHRIGIVETEKQHEELRKIDAMGEIHVTETFHPVLASIKKRIGLP